MLMTRVTAWTAATITMHPTYDRRRTVPASFASIESEERARVRDRAAARVAHGRLTDGDEAGAVSSARVGVPAVPPPDLRQGSRRARADVRPGVRSHLRCAVVDSREPVAGASQPRHTLLFGSRGGVTCWWSRDRRGRAGQLPITRLTSFGDTSTRLGKPRPVTFAGSQRRVDLGGRVAELVLTRTSWLQARATAFVQPSADSLPGAYGCASRD